MRNTIEINRHNQSQGLTDSSVPPLFFPSILSTSNRVTLCLTMLIRPRTRVLYEPYVPSIIDNCQRVTTYRNPPPATAPYVVHLYGNGAYARYKLQLPSMPILGLVEQGSQGSCIFKVR